MNKKLVFLSILWSLVAPAFAQQKELKQAERTCRMVFPEKPSSAPRFVYLFDGKKNHRIFLSAVNFSEVVDLPFGEITITMAPKPITATDREEIPKAYPKLRLSEEVRNFYLFLSPNKDNKVMPLRMQPVNIDSRKFKLGSTLWYNFTNHKIAAKIGKAKLALNPKKSAIVEKPRDDSGYYDAAFIFQRNSKGDFLKITEQRWWLDASSRYVGFISDRGGRLPRIYFFRDYRTKFKEIKEEVIPIEPVREAPVENHNDPDAASAPPEPKDPNAETKNKPADQ